MCVCVCVGGGGGGGVPELRKAYVQQNNPRSDCYNKCRVLAYP